MGFLNNNETTQILNEAGDPTPFVSRYIYIADSVSLAPIYRDPHLTHTMSNPMHADENGVFEGCYLPEGSYDLKFEDSKGTVLGTNQGIEIAGVPFGDIVHKFDTVSAMISDETMAYENAHGRFKVCEGQTIKLVDLDFTYKIASAAATDHHLTTDGGIKLYVVLTGEAQSALQWNISAANSATENDAGLVAMRDQLIAADNTKMWRVRFEPGVYTYTNNRWTRNIRKIELICFGVVFQCVNDSVSSRQKRTFDENGPWFDGDIDNTDSTPSYTGYEIDTVGQGKTTISFVTGAEAANFKNGDRVFLGSSDKQFAGFPPNFRYFQYSRVQSVDEGAGEVELTEATTFEYRADHPHQVSGGYAGLGRARILNLDRDGSGQDGYVHPEIRIVRGLTIRQNPHNTAQGEVLSADFVHWEDIKTEGSPLHIWPSIAKLVQVNRLKSSAGYEVSVEVDKLVDRLIVEDATINGSLSGGTSVLDASFRRCCFGAQSSYEPGGRVHWDRCKWAYDPTSIYGAVKSNSVMGIGPHVFDGCDFALGTDLTLSYLVNADTSTMATPLAVTATGLEFDITDPASVNLIIGVHAGRMLFAQDYSNFGIVQSVTQQGSSVHAAVKWWHQTAASGSVPYCVLPLDYIVDMGNNGSSQNIPFTRGNVYEFDANPKGDNLTGSFTRNFSQFDPQSFTSAVLFRQGIRIMDKLVVDVTRPYAGSDPQAILSFYLKLGASNVKSLNIDLTTGGRREIAVNAVAGAESSDTISALGSSGRLCNELVMATWNGSSTQINYADPSEHPVFSVAASYKLPT